MPTRCRAISSKYERQMRKGVIAALILSGAAQTCAAQVRSVDVMKPRLFGYFVGDVLHDEIDVDVEQGTDLQEASVPQAGPLNAWLELSDSRFDTTSDHGTRRYRIHLSYQTFYPAIDVRQIEVPGFSLSFRAGDRIYPVAVPAWSFGISPLREVLPEAKESGAAYMQPDVAPRIYDIGRTAAYGGGCLLASLIAVALLAYHFAWWPFGARARRPFTEAARHVRRLLARDGAQLAYREALIAIHRAVDLTAGRTILAEDMPEFLDRHPAFARLREEFAAFFASSQIAFFNDKTGVAARILDPDDLCRFSAALAVAERAVS
jgi:mxaA protein